MEASLRLLLDNVQAGSILGRSGQIINEFRKHTHAKICCSHVIPGCMERILTISGSWAEVSLALRIVVPKLLEFDCRQPASVHALLPAIHVGRIVGKSGAMIKKIQQQNRSAISITAESLPASTEKLASVQGSPTAVCHTLLDFLEIIIDQHMRAGPTDVIPYRPEMHSGSSPSGAFHNNFSHVANAAVDGISNEQQSNSPVGDGASDDESQLSSASQSTNDAVLSPEFAAMLASAVTSPSVPVPSLGLLSSHQGKQVLPQPHQNVAFERPNRLQTVNMQRPHSMTTPAFSSHSASQISPHVHSVMMDAGRHSYNHSPPQPYFQPSSAPPPLHHTHYNHQSPFPQHDRQDNQGSDGGLRALLSALVPQANADASQSNVLKSVLSSVLAGMTAEQLLGTLLQQRQANSSMQVDSVIEALSSLLPPQQQNYQPQQQQRYQHQHQHQHQQLHQQQPLYQHQQPQPYHQHPVQHPSPSYLQSPMGHPTPPMHQVPGDASFHRGTSSMFLDSASQSNSFQSQNRSWQPSYDPIHQSPGHMQLSQQVPLSDPYDPPASLLASAFSESNALNSSLPFAPPSSHVSSGDYVAHRAIEAADAHNDALFSLSFQQQLQLQRKLQEQIKDHADS